MGSKAKLYGISTLLGGLMLWTSSAPQSAVSSSPVPFLQAVRNEVSIARTFAPLFQLPAHVEVANAAPAPSPTPSTPPIVIVKEGQSLWDIATARGVSVEAVAEANALSNVELVRPGQRLVIPPSGAAARMQRPVTRVVVTKPQSRTSRAPARQAQPTSGWIVVKQGQTLSEIADQHRTSVRALVSANGLRSAHSVRAGQRLSISGGRGSKAVSGSGRAAMVSPVPATLAVRLTGFLWPARGVLTSRFGWRSRRHHNGIDIAAPYGTPIFAAKAGRVIFSGWYYGYGRTVIVDHGDVTTLYGHASKLLVRNGQTVEAGESIARVGSTGVSTGPHLHFEIRVNGRAVNPLKYL
ncbi:MAG: peptidoglycan DD-metalloendopeptidase family protein [Acidimicrobiia bacterium]